MIDEPRIDSLYRCRATQLLYRVCDVSFYKVLAVQESAIPGWTWHGDRMDFLIDFCLVQTNGWSHKRS
jgi:hypothetical protein